MRQLFLPLIAIALMLSGCTTTTDQPSREAYGNWQGTLPCADCPGVETRLILYKNPNTYTLKETYQDRNSEPLVHEGRWQLLPPENPADMGRISLEGSNERTLRTFLRLADGNLEMLGRNGEKIRSSLNYTLKRKRVSE